MESIIKQGLVLGACASLFTKMLPLSDREDISYKQAENFLQKTCTVSTCIFSTISVTTICSLACQNQNKLIILGQIATTLSLYSGNILLGYYATNFTINIWEVLAKKKFYSKMFR